MTELLDAEIYPVSTAISLEGKLRIADFDLETLASNFGTPLYLVDAATIHRNIRGLTGALSEYYPAESAAAYASKAYLSRRFAQKLAKESLELDVVSLSELRLGLKSGFSADRIHLHGNNKSEEEIRAAIELDVHAIVADNFEELRLIEKLAAEMGKRVRLWLRITPDIRVKTHPHIETSAATSKFGFHVVNGDAAKAIRLCQQSSWLDLTGLHCHLGSQLFDPEPYEIAILKLYEVSAECNFTPTELSPGGGWGVRSTTADPVTKPEQWIRTIANTVIRVCHQKKMPLPKLVVEPGRWLVSRAGVALYRVGFQKNTLTDKRILGIDGGISDNPRVALYQARYTAEIVNKICQPHTNPYQIVGKFCESGDILIDEIRLPAAERGDLLCVPASGAYQLSMASNYNLAARPAVLWLEQGSPCEILQEREIPDLQSWWV